MILSINETGLKLGVKTYKREMISGKRNSQEVLLKGVRLVLISTLKFVVYTLQFDGCYTLKRTTFCRLLILELMI